MCKYKQSLWDFLALQVFSNNKVIDKGNVYCSGPIPRFSDLEVIALSLVVKLESIDS